MPFHRLAFLRRHLIHALIWERPARKAPICEAEIGHRSASVCHLGTTAIRLGRKLEWDPVAQQFKNDKEANEFIAREQRKPYTYEEA